MIPEEKKLKDLCSRIPYGTKVCVPKLSDRVYELVGVRESEPGKYVAELRLSPKSMVAIPIDMVKPYLFPLSSMTEEQEREYLNTCNGYINTCNGYCTYYWTEETFDWLNKNRFDYRGFIEKGSAIDCTNLKVY